MGVTLFLFTGRMKVRCNVTQGISELVHSEADGKLTASIAAKYKPKTGEYLGFMCVDGRFRLFEMQHVEERDETGQADIIAKDAGKAAMDSTIIIAAEIAEKSAIEAVTAALTGTGWQLGTATATGTVGKVKDAEMETATAVLERIADTAQADIVPYYLFDGNNMTGRRVDVVDSSDTYRGRIISSENAENVRLMQDGAPVTRVYPWGGYTGSGEQRHRVTAENVSWSHSQGKPADKPAGQMWIAAQGAEDESEPRGYVFADMNITDPEELAQKAYEDLTKKREKKPTGTAKAGDLSYLPGYGHMSVRVSDQVGVRMRSGEAALARVANIRRDYVKPWQTVLEFGERQDKNWITTQLQELNNTVGGGGGYGGLTQLVEENGIELYQAIEQLIELEGETATQFNQVWIDLDATNARIDLMATSEELSAAVDSINQAGIRIDALNARVDLMATATDNLTGRITGAEAAIDAANAQILLRAYISDVDALENEVYIRISAMEDEIELKADKITLNGYVTMSQFNASMADIFAATIDYINVNQLAATRVSTTYLSASSFTFASKTISRRTATIGDTTINYLAWVE